MSGFPRWEVLSYDHPAEREKWRELYHRFPPGAIDVFYLPEYARLFELHGDGRACCFVYWETPDRFVIYPFHLRFIRDIPEFRHVDPEWTDIINPYGYGGYLASQPGMDLAGFFRAFRDYCRERRVVSELVRFHPLLGNFDSCRPFISAYRQSPVVVVDLTRGPEAVWQGFSPACRNKIRKARKHGVRILVDEAGEHLDAFHRLYTATMARVGARDYYYFSRPWFDQLIRLLEGRAVFFHALLEDRIIASSLFLHDGKYMHYYLSGSDQAYKNFAANNLILQEAALWGQGRGISRLNLGGGVEPDDNLFKFKASFSALTLYHLLAQIINHSMLYHDLLQIKMKSSQIADHTFFPLYRYATPSRLKKSQVIILGASGHAKVCLDYLLLEGWEVVGFFDDNPQIMGSDVHGYPVLGNIDEAISIIEEKGIKAVIAIGDNISRCKIAFLLKRNLKKIRPGDFFINIIHPSAIISDRLTEINFGNFIGPGAIINSNTKIGSFVIINTGATIDHDNIIKDFAQISPGCNLAGNVTIEEGAFLGTGAVVIPGKTIGAYATIGAGAVVIEDIPPYCTAVGVPARVIKRQHVIAKASDGQSNR